MKGAFGDTFGCTNCGWICGLWDPKGTMLEDSGLRTFGGECLKKVCSFLSKFLLQNNDDLSIDGGRSPPLGLRAYLPRGYILVNFLGHSSGFL